MRHFASPAFWEAYSRLPRSVRELADKNLAAEVDADLLWFWIGSHADYDAII